MMPNYVRGFIVSFCAHLALFSALYAFAGIMEKEENVLEVDISLLGLGGSGSGSPDAGGGTGGMPAVAGRGEESAPVSEAPSAPEPEAPAKQAEPLAQAVEPEASVPDAVPVAKPKKVEKKPPPKPERVKKTASPRPREKKAEAVKAPESGKDMLAHAGTGRRAPGAPGQPGAGDKAGAYGSGGGDSGGSGGGPQGGGGGGKGAGSPAHYYDYMQKYIAKHLVYPVQSRRMKHRGVAHYTFYIDKSGRVSKAELAKSSGYSLLDKAGLKAIESSSPLPPPPKPGHMELPIAFNLKD